MVSKTFSTQETLTNATTAKKWFLECASEEAISKHFVAVSTNEETALQLGVSQKNIFPMENWVGGRFSPWSTVALSIEIAVDKDNFEELLTLTRSICILRKRPLNKIFPLF